MEYIYKYKLYERIFEKVAKYEGKNRANKNGLLFEKKTSLKKALEENDFFVNKSGDIYKGDEFIGKSIGQTKMYRFLSSKGVDYKKINSKQYRPDEALLNNRNKTVYIIEKKFQSTSGSVDEKLQTCEFKKMIFQRLFEKIGYKVEYIYVLSDWFKQPSYNDVLEFIKDKGCDYYYNEIPLNRLNIE